jgi:hypothetical protein
MPMNRKTWSRLHRLSRQGQIYVEHGAANEWDSLARSRRIPTDTELKAKLDSTGCLGKGRFMRSTALLTNGIAWPVLGGFLQTRSRGRNRTLRTFKQGRFTALMTNEMTWPGLHGLSKQGRFMALLMRRRTWPS